MYFPRTHLQALEHRLRQARGREYWIDGAVYDTITGYHVLRHMHPDDVVTVDNWAKNNWSKLDVATAGFKYNVGERKRYKAYKPETFLDRIFKLCQNKKS